MQNIKNLAVGSEVSILPEPELVTPKQSLSDSRNWLL
jgi:hypothetical protein